MKTVYLKNASLIGRDAKVISGQDLFVREGRIEAILPAGSKASDQKREEISPEEIIDCSRYYVTPGLANLHVHTAMNIFKGIAEDVTPDAWFNERIWPYESQMTDEDVYVGTLLGIAEMIDNGEDGFLYPFEEPKKLAEAVCKIFSDRDLALRFSEKGHAHAAQTYDRVKNGRNLIEMYQTIANTAKEKEI